MLELTINSALVLSPVGIEPGTSINNATENIADLHRCKKGTHYKSMVPIEFSLNGTGIYIEFSESDKSLKHELGSI